LIAGLDRKKESFVRRKEKKSIPERREKEAEIRVFLLERVIEGCDAEEEGFEKKIYVGPEIG